MLFIVIYFVKKKKSVGSVVAIFLVGGGVQNINLVSSVRYSIG